LSDRKNRDLGEWPLLAAKGSFGNSTSLPGKRIT
jgi:hypothetical protein